MTPIASKPQPLSEATATLISSLAGHFAFIFTSLRGMVGYRFSRDPRLTTLYIPLVNRISRLAQRLQSLLARIADGTWTAPRPRPSRAGRGGGGPRGQRFPNGRGWVLIELKDHMANGYAAELGHQLTQPAMLEILATYPQAGRLLRPLCRMFGLAAPGTIELARCPGPNLRGTRPNPFKLPPPPPPEPPEPTQYQWTAWGAIEIPKKGQKNGW